MNTMEQGTRQDAGRDNVIEMLVKLLYQQNMKEQAQDFKDIFQYVAGMQVQMGVLTNELREVREQLTELQQRQPKEVTKDHINGIDRLQDKVRGLSEHLSNAKDHLVKTASQAVNAFKTKGKAAMCKVLQKGIDAEKSVLTKCRAKMADVMADCGKTANRIDSIGNELKQAGRSMSNVGRLLTGKEAKEVSREQPGIGLTRAINKPIRKAISRLGKNIDWIDRAYIKLDKLSDRLRSEKEEKTEEEKGEEKDEEKEEEKEERTEEEKGEEKQEKEEKKEEEKDTRRSVKERLSEMQAKVDERKKEPEPDKEKEKGKEECL